MRNTVIAVLYQLDHGESGDLLGESFDVDQAGYADAVRDLQWCRDELAAAIGLPEGAAIDLIAATAAPGIPIAPLCDGCRDAVPAWLVREGDEITQECQDCYAMRLARK